MPHHRNPVGARADPIKRPSPPIGGGAPLLFDIIPNASSEQGRATPRDL